MGGRPVLSSITSTRIRTWRTDRLVAGIGRSTVARTYRILHAIFATAVDDDLVRRNPCRIEGAGSDQADERPTVTFDQVFAIARAIQSRYRLLVLLATFAQLRFGELVALRRSSIELDVMELRVRKSTAEMQDGTLGDDDPKSRAGKGPISLPGALKADIVWHLAHIAQPGPLGRLFIDPQGGIPRRRNFNRVWKQAVSRAGIPNDVDLHLHGLRHTGSTWSAQSGCDIRGWRAIRPATARSERSGTARRILGRGVASPQRQSYRHRRRRAAAPCGQRRRHRWAWLAHDDQQQVADVPLEPATRGGVPRLLSAVSTAPVRKDGRSGVVTRARPAPSCRVSRGWV